MTYYIIVFRNTTGVMAAEKQLNELGYKFRIMPTPTNITMSCGMCIRIDEKEKIDKIINDKLVEYKNIYQKLESGYINIEE